MHRDFDMEIAVNIKGREFPDTKTLKAHAYGRICRALNGFPGAADRATVTVSGRGGHIFQCRIRLWVDGEVVMVVHVEHVDPVTGVGEAADRVQRNLARNGRRAPEIGGRAASSGPTTLKPPHNDRSASRDIRGDTPRQPAGSLGRVWAFGAGGT